MLGTLTSLICLRIPRQKNAAFLTLASLIVPFAPALAQIEQKNQERPPVIDIHVHTFGGGPEAGPMCPFPPQFLASDPRSKEAPFGWSRQDCVLPLQPSPSPEDYMKAVLTDYERLNVTAIVMGDPASVRKWKAAAPGRIIMGTSFSQSPTSTDYLPLDELKSYFTKDGFQVLGEVGVQYQGLSPSDPSLDKYFGLAEELDIPVGIHMGTGGSGRANVTMPKFRASMGNPLLLEDLLARHPKLRVWIMHAGYPMIDNLLTLLQANSHVYVDVAGFIWSYPIKEVNAYIQRIVEAGFEDRVMYGTDQLVWPKLMETSIAVIDRASYLTPQQKRDILYNNAARFLRLDKSNTAPARASPRQ
jgi:predicted TIM-barrel fold metal-dependent hydrolase